MRTITDEVRSKAVLIREFLDTAVAAGNEAHARTLENDLKSVNMFISWGDNPTPAQREEIESWLGLK